MTEIALYDRIRARTKAAFGAAINPHLFRDAAATTMAVEFSIRDATAPNI